MKTAALLPLGHTGLPVSHVSGSHPQLCAEVCKIFIQLHRYRTLRKPEHMQVYLSDDAWRDYAALTGRDRAAGEIFHADEISVLSCRELGSSRADGRECILFELRTKMRRWMERESDGAFLYGDRKDRHESCQLLFVSAPERMGSNHVNCPCCGAQMDASMDPVCPYCGETNGILGWMLASAK